MKYGCTGNMLEVDLSTGSIEKQETPPEIIENYLGGKGIAAKIMWERVPPEVTPFSPDNLLVIAPGLLVGSVVPGASHTCISYKSPLTETLCHSIMGGYIGAELKHAGYDSVTISGKSPTPVYLLIDNDRIEIRDAAHLCGKSTIETQHILRKELRDDKVQIMCIGLAGENRVSHATIEHSLASVAGRGGPGAVMGDKGLKAIAVRGTKGVTMADMARLMPLCDEIMNRVPYSREQTLGKTGYTYIRYGVNWVDEGNCSGVRSPERQQEIRNLGRTAQEYVDRAKLRNTSCFNCPYRCREAYPNAEGGITAMKCGAYYYIMAVTQIFDPDFAVRYMTLLQKYGLDIYSTGNSISFAIDLYQKGILRREDVDGLHLEWKNPDVAFRLVEKIAHREGIGDLLAKGTYRAAREIGKGAENYAFHEKKMDAPMIRILHEHHLALALALSEGGKMQIDNATPQIVLRRPREQREAYIRDGWFAYPKEYEKYLLDGPDAAGVGTLDWEGSCYFSTYDLEQYTLGDATGLCIFWLGFWLCASINSRATVADLISGVTGLEIDAAEATRIARRLIHLTKAYHIRDGLGRKDDTLPKHVFQRVPQPPAIRLEEEMFDKLIDKCYDILGWDREGVPTREALNGTGLVFVQEELERRGLLKS